MTLLLTAAVAAFTLTGCGGITPGAAVGPAPIVSHGVALRGSVHGGQQLIAGANIELFAAGTGGYGQATPNLLTATVLTDAYGSFDIGGNYTCTAGQQMYLIAAGGNPGAGINPSSVVMAALVDCASLSSASYISINEITTVGSAFALAPFLPAGTTAATTQGSTAYFARAAATTTWPALPALLPRSTSSSM